MRSYKEAVAAIDTYADAVETYSMHVDQHRDGATNAHTVYTDIEHVFDRWRAADAAQTDVALHAVFDDDVLPSLSEPGVNVFDENRYTAEMLEVLVRRERSLQQYFSALLEMGQQEEYVREQFGTSPDLRRAEVDEAHDAAQDGIGADKNDLLHLVAVLDLADEPDDAPYR